MSEMTDRWQMVAAGFGDRVRSVPADQWSAATPCVDWTARDIVGHVVGYYRSLAGEVTAEGPGPMGNDEEPAAAWNQAYQRLQSLAQDPAALATEVSSPTGPSPLEQVLGTIVSMDTHVHTWDLGRAMGQDVQLDPGVVALIRQMLEPIDDLIRQPGIYGPKIEPPAGADEQTQLLCFLGRAV